MGEGGDYTPGAWAGHDFKEVRATYDRHAGRSYEDAKSSGRQVQDLLPRTIATNAAAALAIVIDETSSMGSWPGVIVSKFPYLDHEMRTQYLGEDVEVSLAAIGDATNGEDYPLQVRPFAKSVEMKERATELVMERKGGPGISETYELAALYYAQNCATPNVTRKPIIIFIGDEMPYDSISPTHARRYGYVTTDQTLRTADVFAELTAKFSVYLIRKPYGASDVNKEVHHKWAQLIGSEQIIDLPEADRVVDVIFGILAKETNKIDYFQQELEGRQTPEQVKTVKTALRLGPGALPASRSASDPRSGKSRIRLK